MNAEQKILQQAINGLTILKAQYTIKTKDGLVHSNMQEEKLRKRSPSVHPIGTYREHVKSQLQGTLQAGDCGVIDSGKYDKERIRSAFLSYVKQKYPHFNATTQLDGKTNQIIWTLEDFTHS